LKKRTKKLLLLAAGMGVPALDTMSAAGVKVFWFFFSKKNTAFSWWLGALGAARDRQVLLGLALFG
jgi:hypothetical protein